MGSRCRRRIRRLLRISSRGGWRFRPRVKPGQSGYPYLVSQGPGNGGVADIWVLYPRAVGLAAVSGGQDVVTGWLVFDRNPGTERLGVVFAARPLSFMEDLLAGSSSGHVESKESLAATQALLGRLAGLGTAQRTEDDGRDWIPERISSTTALKAGDRVRLSLESPEAGY